MKNIPSPKFCTSLVAAAVLLALPTTKAANRTWVGSTSTDWVTNSNWNGGTAFAPADTITFNAAGTQGASLTNTLTNSAFNVGAITFSATASAYTLSGNTFNIAGNITNNSSFLQTFNNTSGLTVDAARTFTVSQLGSLAITNGLTNTGAAGLTTTVNGAGGTLTLGSFTLNSGATAGTTATLAGTGNITVSGAVGNGSAFNNGLTITSTGVVTLNGNNTHTGLTTMNAATGRLVLAGDNTNATGGVTLTTGILDLRSAKSIGSTGALTLTAGNIVNGSGAALTLTNNAPISLAGVTFGAKTDTGGSGDINFGTGAVSYNGVFNTAILGTGATFRFDGTVTNTAGNSIVGIFGAGNTLVFGSTFVLATNVGTSSHFTGSGNLSLLGTVQNGSAVTSSLNWTNTGTLTLSGANTYTGSTGFNSGTVTLDYNSNAGTKISGTGTGGTLTLGGSVNVNLNGGAVTETVNLWNLNAGANAINRTGGSSGKIAAGALTRNAGSTLALGAGGVLSTTTGSANTLLTAGATGAGGVVGVVGGNDWAAKDAANTNVVGLSTTTSTYTSSTTSSVSGNADVVTDVTGSSLAATTLRFNGAAARTIDASGGTLTLSQGGILVTPAVANNLTAITGGTLKAGSSNALFVFQNNTSNGLTIASIIADGTATSTLTKSGLGLLTLSNTTNTYTGKTYLNQGTLNIAADASLGTAPGAAVTDQLTMTGGTLQFGAGNIALSANRGITLIGGGSTIDTNGNDATIAGIITGSGNLTKTGAGTLFLTATTFATNAFSGPLTVKGGIVNAATLANANTNSSIGRGSPINLAADLILDGGTLQYTGTAAASTNRQYTLTTNGGALDASGTSIGAMTFSGAMTASGSSGSQTFTLTGTGTGTSAGTISGTINNGSGTNVTALAKTGTGTWTLSGANTYTGNTTISGGTLTLASTSSTLFSVANASSTQFLGTGTVNFNGSFKFDLSGVSISNGSWTLIDVTNLTETFSLTSVTSTAGMNFTNNAGIWTSTDTLWTFNQSTGILTGGSAVPEPATYAALFGSLVLGISVLRRRRSNHKA